MFKKFFGVALLALVPLLADATAAFVSRTNNTANAVAVTVSPTAGDTLIIGIKTSTGGGTPNASLADNLTDTYSTAVATVSPSGSSWHYTFFYLKNIPSGITTLTASFAGGAPGNVDISILEYSGLDTAAPFIGATAANNQVSPGSATDAITSVTISLTSLPAILIGFSNDNPDNGTPTAGTGFTGRGSAGASAGSATWEEKRFTSNTTPAATFTSASHGTDTFDTFALAFSEPSGGAALAGTASDTTSATASLSTGAAAFAPILLNSGANQINLGSGANTGTGDQLLTAFTKDALDDAQLNVMLSQLYPSQSIQTPTTGFSITVAQGVTQLILNPAGTLATGTLVMPANPGDQQPFEVMTSQTITSLSHGANTGQSLNGALTTLSANTSAKWIWEAALSTWFRQH